MGSPAGSEDIQGCSALTRCRGCVAPGKPQSPGLIIICSWPSDMDMTCSKPSASPAPRSFSIPVCPQTSCAPVYVPEGYFLLAEQPQTRSGQANQQIFAIQLAESVPFLMSSELRPWKGLISSFVLNTLSPRGPYTGLFFFFFNLIVTLSSLFNNSSCYTSS